MSVIRVGKDEGHPSRQSSPHQMEPAWSRGLKQVTHEIDDRFSHPVQAPAFEPTGGDAPDHAGVLADLVGCPCPATKPPLATRAGCLEVLKGRVMSPPFYIQVDVLSRCSPNGTADIGLCMQTFPEKSFAPFPESQASISDAITFKGLSRLLSIAAFVTSSDILAGFRKPPKI
ncbi:hypothetical protein CYMTET_32244 [Cymbomonas tetramitiformis]|uniref:Uncharacterized protein n=1 Tax=Cymbomonas tetramitiformis TaxID=36881 RepID=A0AAE0KSF0_9CHLO|nr:hypothetical protein CYMTET_32244 [Cymbomonas tetramitiformis]